MPYIIAILGLLAAAYFWIMRARNAAEMTSELADVAENIVSAARRFGFRRRYYTHPVDSIDDPRLAIGGIGVAFLQIGGTPTSEQKSALLRSLQSRLSIDLTKAEELDILGQWFVNECNGPAAAIPRLSKRLHKLSGSDDLETMLGVITDSVSGGDAALSAQQRDALDDIKRAFHVR